MCQIRLQREQRPDGGDTVAIFPGGAEESGGSIIWKTHWDSEKDAYEFFKVFNAALEKRFGLEQQKVPERCFGEPITRVGKSALKRRVDTLPGRG